ADSSSRIAALVGARLPYLISTTSCSVRWVIQASAIPSDQCASTIRSRTVTAFPCRLPTPAQPKVGARRSNAKLSSSSIFTSNLAAHRAIKLKQPLDVRTELGRGLLAIWIEYAGNHHRFLRPCLRRDLKISASSAAPVRSTLAQVPRCPDEL